MTRSTWKVFADELATAVTPLREAVISVASFRSFLYRLGWVATSLPPEFQVLGQQVDVLVANVQLLSDEPTVGEATAAVQGLRDIVATLRGLSAVPAGVIDSSTFLAEIGQATLDLLLSDYLASRAPSLHRLLVCTGVLVQEVHVATDTRPTVVRNRFRYDEIAKILNDPSLIPARVYGWGTAALDYNQLLEDVQELLASFTVPSRLLRIDDSRQRGYQPDLSLIDHRMTSMVLVPVTDVLVAGLPVDIGFSVLELPQEGSLLPGVVVEPLLPAGIATSVAITSDVSLTVRAGSDIGHTFGVEIRPSGIAVRYPFEPGRLPPSAGFGLELDYAPAAPTSVLGSASGTHIELAGIKASLTLEISGNDLEVQVRVTPRNLAFVLDDGDQDGFLKSLLGGSARVALPLGILWSSQTGLSFDGGDAFRLTLAPHLKLGAIRLDELAIAIDPESSPPAVTLDVGVDLTTQLGPVAVTVNNVGFSFKTIFTDGNFGPIDLSVGFKPPTGAGIAIDATAVRGSGFLDFNSTTGRYTGALALDASGLALSAIGVLDTKPPTGGYSFAAIISTTFNAIPIGLGFTLNGVGGLIALNRRIDEDALTNALKGPGLADLFFPTDPLAQAARVVTDMAQYFPVADGRYVFGPAAKLGWGKPTLVTADIAILTELPSPIKVVLLGKVHAALPTVSNPLINLNVDVLGILDFEKKRLEIDARLRDSKVLDFSIDGGLGLRIEWGDQPNFIVSVGGFNPQFQPPPGFLLPDRVRIPIGFDEDPRLDVTGYLALTPNTAQIGASVDLYASADFGLSITGDLGFDALFVFDPFSFTIDIAADVSLKRHGDELAGIHLHGKLSGPSPWHVSGKACLSCWLFDLCVPFDVTFGGDAGGATPSLDPAVALTAAIADPANWSGDRAPGAFQSVTLAPPSTGGVTLMDPAGQVRLKQTVVPLNRKITKYLGAAPVGGSVRYDVTQVTVGGVTEPTTDVKDWFAPDQVDQLTDDERLARGAYEKMTAGVSLATDETTVGHSLTKTLGYETIVITDRWTRTPQPVTFVPSQVQQLAHVELCSAASAPRDMTGAAKFAPPIGTPAKVTLADAGYVVASTVTLVQQTGVFSTPKARGDAHAAVADYLAPIPLVDATTLQVIPAYELAA